MSEKSKIGKYWLCERPGNPNWHVCWWNSTARCNRRKSLGTSDLREAKIKLAKFVTKNESVKDVQPEKMPLAAVLVRYYEKHASNLRSTETAKNCLAKWSEFYQDAMVSELLPDKHAEFVEWLKSKGYSNEYINRILTTGIAALNYAYNNPMITYVPPVEKLPAEKPRDRILTLEEAAALIDRADG